MIVLLNGKATQTDLNAMQEAYSGFIKIAVDIRRKVLAGGGEMHADCESVLLENGSVQEDIWGANWYLDEQVVEFESLINIRPDQGNRGIVIQNEEIRRAVEAVTLEFLGGVR